MLAFAVVLGGANPGLGIRRLSQRAAEPTAG
jgi:hypothetical protein